MSEGTLTEFLLARIAEDESAAKSSPDRWGPNRRAAAECEAKRRIVAGWDHFGDNDEYIGGMEHAREEAMQHLAAAYSDHPDYDEAWRA